MSDFNEYTPAGLCVYCNVQSSREVNKQVFIASSKAASFHTARHYYCAFRSQRALWEIKGYAPCGFLPPTTPTPYVCLFVCLFSAVVCAGSARLLIKSWRVRMTSGFVCKV